MKDITGIIFSQTLNLCGKSFELLAVGHQESSLPYNFLGSLCKNYAAAGVNFTGLEKKGITGLIGAGVRTLATSLDDFFIGQELFSEHHLTKISDALYSGYLFANLDPNNTSFLYSLAFGGLFWGISKIMGSEDHINMERKIAEDSYKLAAKIDHLSDGTTDLTEKLYWSNCINAVLQIARGEMNNRGIDFGNMTSAAFNYTGSYLLGNGSTEAFKAYLTQELIEEGPLANRLKFESWQKINPKKAGELSSDISQTLHIINTLPMKYQGTSLSDSIAASAKSGLVFKALNNLFNFNKAETLSELSKKTHKKQEKLYNFEKAVKAGDFQGVQEQLHNQLKVSEGQSFWSFCHKIFDTIIPIAVTSYIAGVIENENNQNSYNPFMGGGFIGKKQISPLLLSSPGLIKGLIDEHTGNPIALDNLMELLAWHY